MPDWEFTSNQIVSRKFQNVAETLPCNSFLEVSLFMIIQSSLQSASTEEGSGKIREVFEWFVYFFSHIRYWYFLNYSTPLKLIVMVLGNVRRKIGSKKKNNKKTKPKNSQWKENRYTDKQGCHINIVTFMRDDVNDLFTAQGEDIMFRYRSEKFWLFVKISISNNTN